MKLFSRASCTHIHTLYGVEILIKKINTNCLTSSTVNQTITYYVTTNQLLAPKWKKKDVKHFSDTTIHRRHCFEFLIYGVQVGKKHITITIKINVDL